MPNAAAPLVVDPLFRCGVLFFSGGIGKDVLRNLLSSQDFLRKQVKAERTERDEPSDCKQEQDKRLTENSLSNGTLLWLIAAFLDGLLSFVCHGFGVFSLWSRRRRCEVMEEYASGFAEHPVGYFIDCEERVGSNDCLACVNGIPSGRASYPNARGFH
jgi:hypothetical protein